MSARRSQGGDFLAPREIGYDNPKFTSSSFARGDSRGRRIDKKLWKTRKRAGILPRFHLDKLISFPLNKNVSFCASTVFCSRLPFFFFSRILASRKA